MEVLLGIFSVAIGLFLFGIIAVYIVRWIIAVWYHAERQKEMVSLLKDIRDRLPTQSGTPQPNPQADAMQQPAAGQRLPRARSDAESRPPIYCVKCEHANVASAEKCSKCGAALSVPQFEG